MANRRRAKIHSVGPLRPAARRYQLRSVEDGRHQPRVDRRTHQHSRAPTGSKKARRRLNWRRAKRPDKRRHRRQISVVCDDPPACSPLTATPQFRQDSCDSRLGLRHFRRVLIFLYALTTGAQFIESGQHSKVLVVGADVMTSILNPEDRTTLILFGDGAGAVLLEPCAEGEEGYGILDYRHEIDGSGGQHLYMLARRRQSPAALARDRRQADALRPPERPGGLQIRRAQDGRAEPVDAGEEQPDRRRHRRVSSPTRPTCRSLTPPPTRSASTKARSSRTSTSTATPPRRPSRWPSATRLTTAS